MPPFGTARQVLRQAVASKAFPAAVVEVGNATATLWREPFGSLSFEEHSPTTREDTIFDLASLTKVLATSSLMMRQVERGVLGVDDPVAQHLRLWRGADRESATLRDLLSHAAGLAAYEPLYMRYRGRTEFEPEICRAMLAYPPRSRSIYSDLGFILLGFILEGGVSLADAFDAMWAEIGVGEELQFKAPDAWKPRTAPTELDPWRGRLLVGEVQDENAAALDGVAGHAGLFGTASSVGVFARHVLQVLDDRSGAFRRTTLETFVSRRLDVPESSRALGWDTMLPTSSCGTRMSPRAFGHTGFTGTSLWIDPERRVYVVLLTNRVHPTRANDAITHVRRDLHDAVIEELP
jgi:CubicO group peptidase (beta-lactamase class C family)